MWPEMRRPIAAAVDVAFVGSFDPRVHAGGTTFVEQIARLVPLDVRGYGAEALGPGSPLLARYTARRWGLAMYGVLADSRIALIRHIDVAEGQANNMRLSKRRVSTRVGRC